MRLSLQTNALTYRFPEDEYIRMLCRTGFDALDYSMFHMHNPSNILNSEGYREYVLGLKKTAEEYGVPFTQAHAPVPTVMEDDEDFNREALPRFIRSLEIAALMGIPHTVVHPVYLKDDSRSMDYNIALFSSLKRYCEEYGVKLALENIGVHAAADNLSALVDALGSPWFTACLDIGHAGLGGSSAPEVIRGLGGRLSALHVHDNDFTGDQHLVPYLGRTDWSGVAKALSDIDYSGDFTFEADAYLSRFPDALVPDAAKLMHDVGRYIIGMIEG